MRILVLSPYAQHLTPTLEEAGDQWLVVQDKITPEYLAEHKIEMGVSYGYRHILKSDILGICPFINLHISYLPWNRGADPNIWSWIDDTPKGVTIHSIDEGIDTGDILVQKEVPMGDDETLSTSYQKLQDAIVQLFYDSWGDIRAAKVLKTPQLVQAGSMHYASDKAGIEFLLSDGFDTYVSKIQEKVVS